MMEPSSSSKRAKTPGNNNLSISVPCLVDGCDADLALCREYHRRHKVCEIHSKTPRVTIGGREQRFCQQCSRFHSLAEFDEGKRSCRKRLDGHNRRRRKPQPDSMSRTTSTFLSSQQGTRMLSFNNPQLHSSAVVGSTRTAVAKPGTTMMPFDNHHPPPYTYTYTDTHNLYPMSSSAQDYNHHHHDNVGNQFDFFQCRTPLSGHRGGDSNRAHSLLSLPPPTHQTPEIMPPVPSGFSQYGFAQEMDHESVLPESNVTTLQFQGMFHDDEQDDSSSSGNQQQTLSFRWD